MAVRKLVRVGRAKLAVRHGPSARIRKSPSITAGTSGSGQHDALIAKSLAGLRSYHYWKVIDLLPEHRRLLAVSNRQMLMTLAAAALQRSLD